MFMRGFGKSPEFWSYLVLIDVVESEGIDCELIGGGRLGGVEE